MDRSSWQIHKLPDAGGTPDGGKRDRVPHWHLVSFFGLLQMSWIKFPYSLRWEASLSAMRFIVGWGLPAQIKWPNDILIHRKKVSGILAETSWNGSEVGAVILGIGINVAHTSIPPVDELQFPASCIDDEHGQPIPRYEILKMVVNTLFEWRKEIGKPDFFQYWQEHLAFQGEPVRIIEDGKTIVFGRQSGILPDGRLEITTSNNAKIGISAGDVHLRPGK